MAALPRITPMLATPGRLPLPGGDDRWAVETKQDGQRAVVYLPGDGTVQVRSRSGEVITSAYPELRDVGGALGGTPAVLDGEIVALDEQGRADFERLQSRMGLTRAPVRAVERAAELTPAHLVLFDVMFLGGQSLLAQPYAERRQVLRSLGLNGPRWSVPGAAVGRSAEALDLTRASGLEGIVCKLLASRYEPGVRSRSWIKIRNLLTTDTVIGGWVPGRGRLTGLPGALLLGERTEGRLRYIGSVGTGWSERERAALAGLLSVAAVASCPFTPVPRIAGAHWVLPRLVGEVTYASRTRAGYLRHPSWHRLRPDLAPGDMA
ncbi:ATP-dependent DNA ligase [Streptomyces sp. NBC_00989]|uniref:ATP-dependent DNA ligase n=1 Tax=Streptomyces sp. NBC_00989 TaxID=2903705 RepID=UPI003864A600|nr:ATP-dependent DNA ligase [Streptomyces sp. NBC_00989]WSW98727.1 ATP-dependent DNA ligase [Streptomyces sp. NBC_00989]